MFYKNLFKLPKKIKYTTIDYDFSNNFDCDSNAKNNKLPVLNLNFNAVNNKLTNSYGEERFYCSYSQNNNVVSYPQIGEISGVKEVKYFVNTDNDKGVNFAAKKIIVQTYDNELYYSNLNDGSTSVNKIMQLDESAESRLFTYCSGQDNYLIVSEKSNTGMKYHIFDANFHHQYYDVEFYIFDICAHNNMVFVVLEDGLRNKICYLEDSEPYLLPSSIDNMIAIDIPQSKGKIMKIISYEDYLYVICEYGIMRIVSYKTQDDLILEDVYGGTARIIQNSIVKAGDNIIFADINNIYILDGVLVKKIDFYFKTLYQDVSKWRSVACFNDGKYYLSTRINYADEITEAYDDEKNNCLIVYDIDSQNFEVCFGISVDKMEVYYDEAQSRIVILSGMNRAYKLRTLTRSGVFNGEVVSRKIYQTSYDDFNTNDIKLIKNINLYTSEDIVLKLDIDGQIFEYFIQGKNTEQCIVVNQKARLLSVRIESKTANPEIKKLKILVGKYE